MRLVEVEEREEARVLPWASIHRPRASAVTAPSRAAVRGDSPASIWSSQSSKPTAMPVSFRSTNADTAPPVLNPVALKRAARVRGVRRVKPRLSRTPCSRRQEPGEERGVGGKGERAMAVGLLEDDALAAEPVEGRRRAARRSRRARGGPARRVSIETSTIDASPAGPAERPQATGPARARTRTARRRDVISARPAGGTVRSSRPICERARSRRSPWPGPRPSPCRRR